MIASCTRNHRPASRTMRSSTLVYALRVNTQGGTHVVKHRSRAFILQISAILTFCLLPLGQASAQETGSLGTDPKNWVRAWNRIAVDASGLDHTPPRYGETR